MMTDMEKRLLAEMKWLAGHYTTLEALGMKPKTIASRHDLFIERAKLCLFALGVSS